MEEILLNLICQEYDIPQDRLFSISSEDSVVEPLAMMTYILNVRYNWKVASIHLFYKSKSYPKKRANLYNLLKRASDNIQYYSYARNTYDSIVHGVDLAKSRGTIVEEEAYLHSIRGRIVAKLYALKRETNLDKVEFLLDKTLQAEFITEGQYEKN